MSIVDRRPPSPGRAECGDLEGAVHQALVADERPGTPDQDQIEALVRAADPLLGGRAVAQAVARVEATVSGLGPLEPLLADPAVTDVLVNGPGPVWVDRAGRLVQTEVVVDGPTIDLVVERVLAPLGRRVDPASPVVDGRLADGSRVHVAVPPVAIDGTYLAIRRFGTRSIPLEEVCPPGVAPLLRWAVRARANVLVVGGTGSGKTTLLNALAAEVPPGERVVTVEDAAELRLPLDHVVRLETRPATVEGVAAVSCRDLVRAALRMRPDRIVVGEVRGGEALDMVQAMNTGHDGSLTTLHANGCDDALRRLETLVLLAGVGLPLDAVRDHLAAAVDLIVHIARDEQGRRTVCEVAEVIAPRSPAATQADASAGESRRVRVLADPRGWRAPPTRPQRNQGGGPAPFPGPVAARLPLPGTWFEVAS